MNSAVGHSYTNDQDSHAISQVSISTSDLSRLEETIFLLLAPGILPHSTISMSDSIEDYFPPAFTSDLLAYSNPITYLVVSAEYIVKLNAPYFTDRGDESHRTYGQTLAPLTVSVAIFLTGRDWWRILREERRKWLERTKASDDSGAVELGNFRQPGNAAPEAGSV